MNTFLILLVIIKTEFRLLVRRLSFWIFLFSLSLLTIVVVFNVSTSNSWLDTLVQVINNLAFYQFALIAMLIAPAVTRNKHKAGDWLWTTSLQSPVLVLGQIIGLALGVCIGLLVSLGLAWLILTVKGSTSLLSLPAFSLIFLTLILPITLLELSITFSLTFALGRVAPAIMLAIVLSSLVWLGILMPIASLSTPLNFTLLTLKLDPIAGFGAEKAFLLPLLSFYLAFSVVILTVSVYFGSQTDKRSGWKPQNNWYISGVFLVAVSFTLYSLYSYQLTIQRRTVPKPVTEQINTWMVRSNSFAATITHAGIEAESQLILQNDSDQEQISLILSLNTGLEVSKAFVNGVLVNSQREGETVHLDFPTTPVAQGESVAIRILYDGVPRLLREDYALVTDVKNGTNPTAFRQLRVSYLDQNVIFLQRDADWLIWPLSSGPHVATEDVELTLTVLSNLPIVSSGQLIDQRQSQKSYYWSGRLPSFLVAVASYHNQQVSNGEIFIPYYHNDYDVQQAELALSLQRFFFHKVGVDELHNQLQAVILPYSEQIILTDSIIGLPSTERVWNLQNGQKGNEREILFNFAADYSRAWLLENIAWPRSELTTEGQLRSSITTCGSPDENGQQQCEVRSLGGVNPQAPQGRLVEQENDSPLLKALSVYFGYLLVTDIMGDDLFRKDQLMQLSMSVSNSEPDNELATINELRLPQVKDFIQCQTTVLILALNHLHDDLQEPAFTQLIHTLITQHPIGGKPLTEDGFWLITNQFTDDMDELRKPSLECMNFIN